MSATTLSFVILNSTSSLPPSLPSVILPSAPVLLFFLLTILQGWEFAHLISERIARFFYPKMSHSLKKMSDLLIHSFLVSDLSDSLMISHFLWATWANPSWSLIFGERPERFARIAHLIWAKWAIHSHRSPKKRKWAKMSDSLIFSIHFFKSYIKHT